MATWMQTKTLKLKKQKRLFPKSYAADYVRPRGATNHKSMALTHPGKDLRPNNRSLAFDDTMLNFIDVHTRFKGKTPCRVEVEAAIRRISDLTDENHIFFTILDTSYHRVRVFFNSQHTSYVLWHEDLKKGTIMTSISYGNKERIRTAWEQDKVTWVECSALSDTA